MFLKLAATARLLLRLDKTGYLERPLVAWTLKRDESVTSSSTFDVYNHDSQEILRAQILSSEK